MKLSYLLVIGVALIFSSCAAQCTPAVPFQKDLVGKSFQKLDECYRPAVVSTVSVFGNRIEYIPMKIVRFLIHICDEKIIFRFRPGSLKPFILFFPAIDNDGSIEVPPEDRPAYCRKEQPKLRERYSPVGKTRSDFIAVVRKMVTGTKTIRDHGCPAPRPGSAFPGNGPPVFENKAVDGIVTYLIGVGYANGFCAET